MSLPETEILGGTMQDADEFSRRAAWRVRIREGILVDVRIGGIRAGVRSGLCGASWSRKATWRAAAFVIAGCVQGCSSSPGDGAGQDADTSDDVAIPDDRGTSDDGEAGVACGNGVVEWGEECDGDPPRACLTACRSAGVQDCTDCRWERGCEVPDETCNGVDDDCNGLTDETFECIQGATDAACENGCGVAGTRGCSATCSLVGACCPEFEACGNGCDDDCDGATDETGCDVGAPCADDAACAGSGLVCNESWGICVVPDCAGEPDFRPCEVATAPDRSYDICVDGACVSPGCGDWTCNVPGPDWPLADTNQRICIPAFGVPWGIEACTGLAGADECATTEFCGQDAEYGWDTEHDEAERFTLTRPTSEEPTVRDNVTGLLWVGCLAGRSGPSCRRGGAESRSWADALGYCGSLVWGGNDDWRLPDVHELLSIVDYRDHEGLMVDPEVFPRSSVTDLWSSTVRRSTYAVLTVSFNAPGGVSDHNAEDELLFRCVRGGRPHEGAPSPRLGRSEPVDGEPVVSDAVTGLLWQGCDAGLAGTDCAGDRVALEWRQALAYCEGSSWGGFTDWRLPNVKEMRSLIDDHREDPRLDPGVFPSPDPGSFPSVDPSYWSSTSSDYWHGGSVPEVETWGGALVVPNSLGLVHPWRKIVGAGVLCVRQGH